MCAAPPGPCHASKKKPNAPRAAQERFRSGLGGHLAPNCRPRAPRRPPGGHFGSLGARFWSLRGPIFEASAASSAAFRGAASTASPPFQSTTPEAKIAKECQNQKPAHGSSKQALATKRLGFDFGSHFTTAAQELSGGPQVSFGRAEVCFGRASSSGKPTQATKR